MQEFQVPEPGAPLAEEILRDIATAALRRSNAADSTDLELQIAEARVLELQAQQQIDRTIAIQFWQHASSAGCDMAWVGARASEYYAQLHAAK